MRQGIARVVMLAVLAAFALLSMVKIRGEIAASPSFERLEPNASTDGFLRILRIPHPAAKVESALRALPAEKATLFIGTDAQPFTIQTYFMVAMLAYPRPTSLIVCGPAGKPTQIIERSSRSDEIGGLVYFNVDPGGSNAPINGLAPKLYVVPHQGTAPWESYCHSSR